MTPFSGPVNLPEWFTELRKLIYLLDGWFIMKDVISEQPDGEIHRARLGRVPGAVRGVPLSSVWTGSCPPTWKLSEPGPFGFCGGSVARAVLIKSLVMDASYRGRGAGELQVPALQAPGPSPHPWGLPRSHLINTNSDVVKVKGAYCGQQKVFFLLT